MSQHEVSSGTGHEQVPVADVNPVLRGRIVNYPTKTLRPHSSYVRLLAASPPGGTNLMRLGDWAFGSPVVITSTRTIVSGYAQWRIAMAQERPETSCIEYELSDEEGLIWLLQDSLGSRGLSSFCRILLALELEPYFTEKARQNQIVGGQKKGLSTLTEVERLDVRKVIANAARVSVGNVTKVRQLTESAHPEVIAALRTGEVRIHRAWLWHKEPLQKQLEALELYRNRGTHRKIRTLISKHVPKDSLPILNLDDLTQRLSARKFPELGPVRILVLRVPGKMVCITEDLSYELGLQGGLPFAGKSSNR